MKVSVIIPLYNKRDYVRKAIESVWAQTYTDYELIVVDDGSTDGSAQVVEDLFSQHKANITHSRNGETSNMRVIHQANVGVAAARNKGVAASQGEYIAFLDADDWWASTYLEKMAELIDAYPDAGIYACNYWYVKTGKTHIALDIPTGYFNYPKTYVEQKSMPVTSISVMMPRKVFDEMGGFPVGIKLGEDFLLWSQIALRYKVAFLNEALAYYNNDIPAKLRATRNLHAPETHMLFRMEHLAEAEKTSEDWKRLCDWLRVGGLLDYWMDKRYHNVAAEELQHVDWSHQSAKVKRVYKTPIWVLKTKRRLMQVGSWCKQKVVRCMTSNV